MLYNIAALFIFNRKNMYFYLQVIENYLLFILDVFWKTKLYLELFFLAKTSRLKLKFLNPAPQMHVAQVE